MIHPKNQTNSPRKPVIRDTGTKSGFALIVSLSLMALVILLVVTLAGSVSLQSQSASRENSVALKRNAALLGAAMALGDLQTLTGPDRRATAQAGLFDSSDPQMFAYTGVWDSGRGTGSDDPDDSNFSEQLGWLVSGTNPDPTTPPDTDWPILVSERAGGAIPAVRAEPVDLGESRNRVAWWIGGEASKASLAFASPDPTLSDAETTRFARRHAAELTPGWSALSADDPWNRVSLAEDVAFLNPGASPDAADLRDRFHDFTPLSRGVLADARDGGLRRDLTAGLRENATDPEDETGIDSIFPPQWGGPADEDPGGPLWEQLRDFYNYRVSGTSAGTIALRSDENGSEDETFSVTPVITWAQIYVHALRANESGDRVRFYLMPAVAIWNPYQHSLQVPGMYFGADLTDPDWKVSDTPDIEGTPVDESLVAIARSNFPNPLVWRIPGGTWAPGEVKMFSMGAHQESPLIGYTTLSQGWNSGFGLYQDRPVYDETIPAPPPPTPRPTVPLSGNLHLAFDQSSGNSHFYLSTSPTNLEDNAFHQARRMVTWSQSDKWRQIFGSDGITGPGAGAGSPPLGPGTHGNPMPRIGYLASMKFAQEYLGMSWIGYPEPVPFLAQYNPRARFSSRSPGDLLTGGGNGGYNTNPLYTSGFRGGDADYPETGNYAVGYSSTLSGGGQPFASYFELLREDVPVTSIGGLMQAGLERTNNLQPEADGWLYTNIQPAFPIGNSLADPRIPANQVFVNWNSLFSYRSGTHYDQSWLLNDALWDGYFFSTVPEDISQADLDSGQPLPNPNMKPRPDATATQLTDYRFAASDLLLDGSFNVNSTSVEAWKALLGGLWQTEADPIAGDAGAGDNAPFPRTFRPMEGAWNNDPATGTRTHSGFRRLSDPEINDLAGELVAAIRARVSTQGHPFLSLSSFVNRNPDSPVPDHQRMGVIQQAIDDSGINDLLSLPSETLTLTSSEKGAMAFRGSDPTHYQPDNAEGPLLRGVSSFLTQGDVLSKIGQFLAVRSDTFRIRAHGQRTDLSGDPIPGEESWVELIVQRTPEPVFRPASGDPDYDADDPENLDRAAGPFGRSYEVLSFRFLDSSDI